MAADSAPSPPHDAASGAAPGRSARARGLSRGKRLAFGLAVNGIWLVAFFYVAERITLRKGYLPWLTGPSQLIVEPAGRMVAPHPTLGYVYQPGRYHLIFKGKTEAWQTNGPDGYRITGPPESPDAPPRPEVWVLGCSYTYGYGLNDADTYLWLLQAAFPEYRIINLGVPGYGTVHSLIQFRERVAASPAPALAILAYSGVHDVRNTFDRSRRKEMGGRGPRDRLFPFARLGQDGSLILDMADTAYRPFPFMGRSAFVHLLESRYTRFVDSLHDSYAVSRALVLALDAECRAEDVPLVVAGIHLSGEMLAYCRTQGIRNVDIEVDLFNYVYYDRWTGHSNAAANRLYADHLIRFLRVTDLLPPPPRPAP